MRKTVLLAAALASVVALGGAAWAANVLCDGGECLGTDGDDAILGSDVRDDLVSS